jgi:tagaturonate reductase
VEERLNKNFYLNKISNDHAHLFDLPERIIQFGTGVLLRALPDEYVDKANKEGIFNGRIVVVKSTSQGGIDSFAEQNNLYTTGTIGYTKNGFIELYSVNTSISEVLNANHEWESVIARASNPDINIVISNTTEKGIELVKESIFSEKIISFPAKLLAYLFARYIAIGEQKESRIYVLPTELINNNGDVLRKIIIELIKCNELDAAFITWFHSFVTFHNTLVDRIVPGKPKGELINPYFEKIGYIDENFIIAEPYNLWAIEGDQNLRDVLTFAKCNSGIKIAEDINKFKELKLRLLNAAHTFSAAYSIYHNFTTVSEAMSSDVFDTFIEGVFNETINVLDITIPMEERIAFKIEVKHRFKNTELKHYWTSIILNYTDKFKVRCMPLITWYYQMFDDLPPFMMVGLQYFLKLSVPDISEQDGYYKIINLDKVILNDPQSKIIFEQKSKSSVELAKLYIIENLLSLDDENLKKEIVNYLLKSQSNEV